MFPKETQKKITKKPMTSFVFLSLILILLCFFIFLFSISSFEQSKVDAVGYSLKNAFLPQNKVNPIEVSFEANTIQIFHTNQIKKIFPDSSITQNGNSIFVSFAEKDIFKDGSSELSSVINVWTNQIKKLLNIPSLKQKYTLEITFFEDLKASEDYPIYQHLTTKRIANLTSKMNDQKIDNHTVRIAKGNASRIIFSFKIKESL